MPDVIHAAIENAASQGKYLNTETLDEIRRSFQTVELRLSAANKISANVGQIIKETFDNLLINTDLTRPGGSMYTNRHYAACIRDLHYFLRYTTYAMLAGNTTILDEKVLNGLKETYNSLGVPIDATIQAIQAMKEVTARLIEPEAVKEINVYFDYICAWLQTDNAAPTYKEEPVSDREQQVQSRIINYVQIWLNQLSPAQKERVADKLEKAIAASNSTDAQDDLTESLVGRRLTKQERIELEFSSLLRYFNQRRELLDGALTASQVATLLGTSRQTPHDRVKAGSLLAILDNGLWRFPVWQFDPAGPDGMIAGLPEVLRSLEVPAYSQLSWLVRPNSFLNGITPVEALKQGQKELVLHAVRAVGVK